MTALITRVRSSRRSSALTVAGLIVLVAAAGWFALIAPKRSDASKLKTDVATAQANLATATQEAAAANRNAAAAALRALPGESDQPGILDNLNALGKHSGVTVASITPNLTTATPNAVALTLIVDGKYFQVVKFLNKLRTQVRVGKGGNVVASGRLFDVQSVNIAQGTLPGQLAATIMLNASIYVVSTPATTSAGTSTTASSTVGAPN